MTFSHCHLKFAHHALFEDFHFDLSPGQWTCILGKSGVGKSSLLKILAGLIQPDSINKFTTLDVAYLPQQDCLMPWLSVWENIFLGERLRGRGKKNSPCPPLFKREEEKTHHALNLLTRVGLAHAAHLKPDALSGGMRQRVALVRTLMEDKPIILMDEPFAALDISTRLELHDLIVPLLKNKTVLLVTHDPLDAVRLADKIQFMAGEPAQLTPPLTLNEPKPRDLQHPPITKIYMQLLKGLTCQQ